MPSRSAIRSLSSCAPPRVRPSCCPAEMRSRKSTEYDVGRSGASCCRITKVITRNRVIYQRCSLSSMQRRLCRRTTTDITTIAWTQTQDSQWMEFILSPLPLLCFFSSLPYSFSCLLPTIPRGLPLIPLGRLGISYSGSPQSPAAKRIMVHFEVKRTSVTV